MSYYAPGAAEKDLSKVIMSLQQVHSNAATNTVDIATINTTLAGKVTGPSSATDNALARFDATTGKLIQNSEITLGDTDGKLSRAAGISVAGTNTNDSAAAGYVGEYISASGSSVSLTDATTANIASVSLTAGDWDVWGAVVFEFAATTNFNVRDTSISTTSATHDLTAGRYFIERLQTGTVPGSTHGGETIGPIRISLSGTTTVYLTGRAFFTVSTTAASGMIQARRVR